MKKIVFVLSLFFVFTFISCVSTQTVNQTEVKENEGAFFINNRDSQNNPILFNKIIIKNKTAYYGNSGQINLIIFGTNINGTEPILNAKLFKSKSTLGDDFLSLIEYDEEYIEYRNNKEYTQTEPEYDLSSFESFSITTLNGTITKSNIKVSDGNLYITIYDYDFSKIPKIVKEANEKVKKQEEETKQQAANRFE